MVQVGGLLKRPRCASNPVEAAYGVYICRSIRRMHRAFVKACWRRWRVQHAMYHVHCWYHAGSAVSRQWRHVRASYKSSARCKAVLQVTLIAH